MFFFLYRKTECGVYKYSLVITKDYSSSNLDTVPQAGAPNSTSIEVNVLCSLKDLEAFENPPKDSAGLIEVGIDEPFVFDVTLGQGRIR